MRSKSLLTVFLSLLMILAFVPVSSQAESFSLPREMTDKNGNVLCQYQIQGKTLTINTDTDDWFWPFYFSDNRDKQNLFLATKGIGKASADGVLQFVLNPLVQSGTVDTVSVDGGVKETDFDGKSYWDPIQESFQFQRNDKGQVIRCIHDETAFQIQYDSQNRIVSLTGSDYDEGLDKTVKNEIRFSYGENGRLKQVSIHNFNDDADPKFRFDSEGRIIWRDHGSWHGCSDADYYFTYQNGRLAKETYRYDGVHSVTDYIAGYNDKGQLVTLDRGSDDSLVKFIY